ncbi:MAG: 6,7-dimethyl-8-ribityllumazine synthase [Candidatus Omnitrophica bacterium]|nr:6,7-dimethyl-8-ribityllumazine synthase [Candidatus Omnitrophota bacterium]
MPPRSSPRFGIVVGCFNKELTGKLHEGALQVFKRRKVSASRIETFWVPGAFEIPVVIHRLALSGRFQALVALGAVIRGKTDHYDAICREVARGISDSARTTGVPVAFGVIMARRYSDAKERSGEKWNLGAEAAETAFEMTKAMKGLHAKKK